ncbi:TMEM175 family protein [Rathayibacter soli]|uniref:TMEM175 family protein n=1 Tax=Rathayibacter soli TaxID=3144168 RepID=UPI0027E4B738|nr:TMEM175 family protein [Glaciibacter superstes]
MQTARGLDRLVFFTDAVTAIAITLLILPLVDSVSGAATAGHNAAQFLADNVNQLGAFALSFAVIARFWVSHHSAFEHVKSYNGQLLLLSLVWAFTIVVLPLPTEMISQFATTPVTVGIYIGTLTASSVTLLAMTLLIRRHPQLEDPSNPMRGRKVFASIATTIGFAVALVIGVLVPPINFFALLVVFLSIPAQRIYDRRAAARAPHAP